jgi:OOP family OmpA-OmpF porin
MITSFRMFRSFALAFGLALVLSPLALGQDSNNNSTATRSRTVASGEKMKIKGVVVKRDADTFTVRDLTGNDTVVRLTDKTSVKSSGGFLRSGTNYGSTNILRGLNLEVEGRGGSNGELIADRVRFSDTDLRTARTVETRANPLEERATATEGRLSEVEQNAQKLSGQLDELAAVSNAARGGAKAAQETADQAVAGVNATNDRISALDDYTPMENTAVNFRTGSAVLLPDAKTKLDEIATKALNAKAYVVEVTGHADATGNANFNRQLSQRRADAVIRYLVEQHKIPLRRIITPYGFGATEPIADNKTREGRLQNRRVEVKILVNKGLTQPAPTMGTPGSSGSGQ